MLAVLLATFFGMILPSAKVVDLSVKKLGGIGCRGRKAKRKCHYASRKNSVGDHGVPLMFFAAVMRREFQRDTGASEKFQG